MKRLKGKQWFCVIGQYADNEQFWSSSFRIDVTKKSDNEINEELSVLAIKECADGNNWSKDETKDQFKVIAIVEGDPKIFWLQESNC